jgi:uncharacterized lipoprotein YmbA
MTRLHIREIMWPLAMLIVGGCASSPPARIYVLGNPLDSTRAMIVQPGRSVIRLLPVSVPDYLDTEDILFHSGPNELKASPTGRWGERLSVGVTHALAADLTTRLSDNEVIVYQPVVPPAQLIVADVQIFEMRPDRQCLLTAQWTLSSGDGKHVLRRERDNFVEQATDASDASIAGAMSRAIDRLAAQIVAAMPS